jgi:hypothetical protein
MIKVIKLKKKDYYDLEGLLERAGLVDKESNTAFPERDFASIKEEKSIHFNTAPKGICRNVFFESRPIRGGW